MLLLPNELTVTSPVKVPVLLAPANFNVWPFSGLKALSTVIVLLLMFVTVVVEASLIPIPTTVLTSSLIPFALGQMLLKKKFR